MSGARLWGGRFAGGSAEAFDRLNASLPVDRRLWAQDIAGSRAHARMLGACGIIPREDAEAIDLGLEQIAEEIGDGDFAFADDGRGHPHGGRAPPDRDRRRRRAAPAHRPQPQRPGGHGHPALPPRARGGPARAAARAGGGPAAPGRGPRGHASCPACTHSQRAQPVRLAHHLLAYVWMLGRDRVRLGHVLEACEECPLGSGALAGVGFPVDRDMVARELGFARPDAQQHGRRREPRRAGRLPALRRAARRAPLPPGRRDRLVGLRRRRLRDAGRRLQLGLVDAAPEEEPRRGRAGPGQGPAPGRRPGRPAGRAGRACRWRTTRTCRRTSATCSTRSTPSSSCCPRSRACWRRPSSGSSAMAAACEGGFLAATDLADHLVALGWPFRRAHEAVGRLVRACAGPRRRARGGAAPADLAAAGLDGLDLPPLTAEAVGRGQGGARRHGARAGAGGARVGRARSWRRGEPAARPPGLRQVRARRPHLRAGAHRGRAPRPRAAAPWSGSRASPSPSVASRSEAAILADMGPGRAVTPADLAADAIGLVGELAEQVGAVGPLPAPRDPRRGGARPGRPRAPGARPARAHGGAGRPGGPVLSAPLRPRVLRPSGRRGRARPRGLHPARRRRARRDRRGRALPAGRPRLPQLPRPHAARRGDVRAARPGLRLPQLRPALVPQRGVRAGGPGRRGAAARAGPDRRPRGHARPPRRRRRPAALLRARGG